MCAHLCQNDNNEYLNQSHISENLCHKFSHLHLGGSSCHIRHRPTFHKCILTSITHEIQVWFSFESHQMICHRSPQSTRSSQSHITPSALYWRSSSPWPWFFEGHRTCWPWPPAQCQYFLSGRTVHKCESRLTQWGNPGEDVPGTCSYTRRDNNHPANLSNQVLACRSSQQVLCGARHLYNILFKG